MGAGDRARRLGGRHRRRAGRGAVRLRRQAHPHAERDGKRTCRPARGGLDDVAIHDAIQVIAYFNYINRVADAVDWSSSPSTRRVHAER